MKWLVWLLLVANVAIFGYFKLQESRPGESRVGHEPINPEKLTILSQAELDALPKKSPPSAPAAPSASVPSPTPSPVPAPVPAPQPRVCYDWGNFSSTDIQRARHVLDKLKLEASIKQHTIKETTLYWIYIPPRKTMEEAHAKVTELVALGVEESFIVEEPKWRFAISLGMFKDESLAERFLDDLRKRGVKSAVKGVRNYENGQASFRIKNMNAATVDEIGKLKPDFPGSELKEVFCQ